MRTRTLIVGLVVVIVAVVGAVAFIGSAQGFSARSEPSALERVVARTMRSWAVPRRMRNRTNPVAFSPEVWADSRAHFADHCATCHANDGSGNTEIGRNLYPRAPDMRLADTQRLTDGELYWIIENGVRLTGMPAWGEGGDNDQDSWKLVHFIRHLKDLTPEQVDQMKSLNPKTPDELKEEEEDRQFLEGKDDQPSPADHDHHHH
jgi:hypothetical protein